MWHITRIDDCRERECPNLITTQVHLLDVRKGQFGSCSGGKIAQFHAKHISRVFLLAHVHCCLARLDGVIVCGSSLTLYKNGLNKADSRNMCSYYFKHIFIFSNRDGYISMHFYSKLSLKQSCDDKHLQTLRKHFARE